MFRKLSHLSVALGMLVAVAVYGPVFGKAGGQGPQQGPTPLTTQQMVTKGQGIYVAKCMTCHNSASSADNYVRFGVNPATLKFFRNQPAPGPNGAFPLEMWQKLNTLSDQDMDAMALYLTMMDATQYTLKGRVFTTNPLVPLANATVRMQTKYLAGEGYYFAPIVAQTDAQGYYTIKCLAGAKFITVSKNGYTFAKNRLDYEFNFYTKNNPPVTNGGNTITVTKGPGGTNVTASGFNFYANQIIVLPSPTIIPKVK